MITTKLQEIGCEIVSFGQGFASMSEPSKSLEKRVLGKELVHGNNKVFNWTVSNVILETDAAGNYKPNKKKSKDRIDPVVASIMALGRAELSGGVSTVANVSWV
jgi:phage terminase large subunit-like protein